MTEQGERILTRAMKTAVKLGVFPKTSIEEDYLRNWGNLEEILRAALEGTELEADVVEERVPR